MKPSTVLIPLSLASAFWLWPVPAAAADGALHVLKSTISDTAKSARLCLEFDKPLASISTARLPALVRLQANGKTSAMPSFSVMDSSLCLFPLARGVAYALSVKGLRGQNDERMDRSYTASFVVPHRTPSLSIVSEGGAVGAFGEYDRPLIVHAVNVPRVNIDVYRISDIHSMARAWQGRTLTALAASESAALAREKGSTIWREEIALPLNPDTVIEQKLSLKEKMPDLAPGLYLVVANAGNQEKKPAKKGLTPLAAAWIVQSDFSMRAVRDADGVRVIASSANGGKANVRLTAFDAESAQIADEAADPDGMGAFVRVSNVAAVLGADPAGNVAFANVEDIPSFSKDAYPDALRLNASLAAPLTWMDAFLSPAPLKKDPEMKSVLRLSRGDFVFADLPVPATAASAGKMSFQVPALPGNWTVRWQKTDGTVLDNASLRVTNDPDAPRLGAKTESDVLSGTQDITLTIRSVSAGGRPSPFVGGRVFLTWKNIEGDVFGWKGYLFGAPGQTPTTPVPIADFLTDPNGTASLRLALPPPPEDIALYQATLKVSGNPDTGVEDADELLLPLRPEETIVGIKPLARDAHFPPNSKARFALIGLSPEGKPRDVSDLSFRIYEEGRSFAWFQDEGRWKYKPEAQLRAVGNGPLSIKADGSSFLEWPVAAGKYRVEILDSTGKVLARTAFSSGWDAAGLSPIETAPLTVSLPKTIRVGRETAVRIAMPEDSVLTVIVADTRIRKIVREARPKGNHAIVFTSSADWGQTISVNVVATPREKSEGPMRTATVKGHLTFAENESVKALPAVSAVAFSDPSALVLRTDESAGLDFRIENFSSEKNDVHYGFTASPGLDIDGPADGDLDLSNMQSRGVSVILSASTVGKKELKLEASAAHAPRLSYSWPIAVLSKGGFFETEDAVSVGSKKSLVPTQAKTRKDLFVLISRCSVGGLAEVLSAAFDAQPFTTEEIALTVDAFRLWRDTMDQLGIAPAFAVDARIREYMQTLLRRQNQDGGFSAFGDGESTMDDTAFALTALASVDRTNPANGLAAAWIKQRLSNTWFDEKERAPRAAAFAALAAANDLDPSNLHYFSDTSAQKILPPVAEAQIAAAFKHIHEPDAAAFWIKKMLDENAKSGKLKSPAVLNALAATDALSSDDVVAATADMGAALRRKQPLNVADAAGLLRAAAVNVALAGKFQFSVNKNDTRTVNGIFAANVADAAGYRSGSQPLFVALASQKMMPAALPPQISSVSRHFYRLNGVELAPGVAPVRGETYMVEIKGTIHSSAKKAAVLVQHGGNGLRPIGCPLTPGLGTLSFIPWLVTSNLTPVADCELSPHGMNAVFYANENDKMSFSIVSFARIDARTTNDIPAPRVRILKSSKE